MKSVHVLRHLEPQQKLIQQTQAKCCKSYT